ncbi:MAG: cadherin-like beta sandwich domain-containing protein [Nitrospira sp.]|nr:cadherin-like beta sandwich domain-containing protein [Nitrospira sp.]
MSIETAKWCSTKVERSRHSKTYSLWSPYVAKYILNNLPQQKVSGSTMTYPLIRTARSFTGMALVILGLSTYGCGDTGTATQPAELGNLSVSAGDLQPTFTPAITSYTVQLPTDVLSTTITATPRVSGDTIRIDNQQVTSQTITLDSPGTEKSINIVVTETGTGGTSKSYTVQVKRASLTGNNSLANLTVSPGILAPEFDKSSVRYTVSVDNNIRSVTITPTLSDPAATMTVNGQPATSGQARAINLNAGNQVTTITIAVTAQDGSTQSYEVAVSSKPSNNLQGLTISPGTLAPAFRASGTGYTVNVSSGVGSVTIRPTLADTRATMTVNGQAATSGQSQTITLNPPGSPTIITIFVIVPDVLPKQYSVTVNRAALGGNSNLSALAVTPSPLDSPFSADDLSYTVNVDSSVGSVTVRPTLADPAATMTVNGQSTTSGQSRTIQLAGPNTTTSIPIVVTAQNGSRNTYLIVVNKAASTNNLLSALRVQVGNVTQTLVPSFNTNTSAYTVNVGADVPSVSVTATKADPNAAISGDLPNSGQATIQLDGPGTSKVVSIIVTAPNGTPKSYAVTINRAAPSSDNNLSALSVSQGSLTPIFAPDTLAYSMDVTSDISSINVAATKADSNAVISGSLPNSGQATVQLDGPGTSKVVSIIVTAANGISKTYAITVNRAAAPTPPAKPATAPDLITSDDSCPLILTSTLCFAGSNTDNITNVKKPGFSVPTPGTGETAKVYIKKTTGEEFPSASTPAGNTLIFRPNVDLPDGFYEVTYTLSNSVGESDKSPVMTPQLEINTTINN